MNHPPYRVLHLTSPLARGEDIRRVQVASNALHRARHLETDGQYGPMSQHELALTAKSLGLRSVHWTNGLSKHAQRIIRNPKLRTPLELARARSRREAAEQAAKDHQGQAVVDAAMRLIRTNPQREVDMRAQPWCGAFVHHFVKAVTGIDLPHDIRYCPNTERYAKTRTGGFLEWIPASRIHEAPVGSLLLWGASEADHVSFLVERVPVGASSVRDAGGNTSSGDGSPSDGGMTAQKTRSIDGDFPLRGAAVWRGC